MVKTGSVGIIPHFSVLYHSASTIYVIDTECQILGIHMLAVIVPSFRSDFCTEISTVPHYPIEQKHSITSDIKAF